MNNRNQISRTKYCAYYIFESVDNVVVGPINHFLVVFFFLNDNKRHQIFFPYSLCRSAFLQSLVSMVGEPKF